MEAKTNSKTKVAVIGLGYWGPNLLRNFLLISNVNVIYGCDIIKKNLNKLSREYPSVKFTTNFDDVLSDESIDLVAIATPLSTHFDLAKKALNANKHVLLEKPMVSNSKEAKFLIALAKKKNKILMVGYTFIYSEPIKKIKQIIKSNQLGRIYYFDSNRINLGLIQKDINVIWDLACHDFSILNYLFNQKPTYVQTFGSKFINNKHVEIAHIIIRYKKDITAHINVSWLSPVKIRSILIGGSKKMISYDDISPNEKIKMYEKSIKLSKSKITPFSPAYRSGDVIIPYMPQTEPLKNELEHLVNCVKNNKRPITDGEMGLEIIKLLEATDKSLKLKSEVKI